MLLIAFMQVSLAANGQKISLSKKNAPLTEIFKELRKQSGYDFVINKDQIRIAKPVTILVNGDELINVLNKCFEGQPFSYSMEEKMIIVVNKKSEQEEVRYPILNIDVSGKVLDEKGEPIIGASITVKGTTTFTITVNDGSFVLKNIPENAILEVSSIGYKKKEIKVEKQLDAIILEILIGELDEVNIINTGYQTVKPNEMNGTVSFIGEKALNARSGTSILDRLSGQSSGLVFQTGKTNANPQSTTNINIRGLGTIIGPLDPLIVLDGFIYDGDYNNINPNDVENVTILKDAAAASIWGARAGNGVIVITTKKGKLNQATQISANINYLFQGLPKLEKLPDMTSEDYIDVERQLFNSGYFNDRINSSPWAALTPVVEILLAQRTGKMNLADANAQIQSLANNNTRKSYLDNFYTKALTQQYSLNVKGGGDRNSYLLSAAYDRSKGQTYETSNRLNFHLANDFKILKNLNLQTNIYYTDVKGQSGRPKYNSLNVGTRNPTYLDFASPNGLAVQFRSAYTDTLAKGKLLDWKYFPTEEYKHSYTNQHSEELFANASINYKLFDGLDLQLSYQYQRQNVSSKTTSDAQSYVARNLINTFSQYNNATGIVTYPAPKGGILSNSNSNVNSQTARFQINYNKIYGFHSITGIIGGEARASNNFSDGYRRLGYQSDPLYSSYVDEVGIYQVYPSRSSSQIGGFGTPTETAYRFLSQYANVAYSYKGRYILSASARRDGSNIFGASTNDKWKPLWSTGLGWKISQEGFYDIDWLPVLSLTTTYGYSGNVDLSRTASPIAGYAINPVTGLPLTRIASINNPSLRWEQLGQLNIKLDFELKRRSVAGSVSWYVKTGTDLYGKALYDYTTWGGADELIRNVADMRGYGVDADMHLKNIHRRNFNWDTDLYFSYNLSKTTNYFRKNGNSLFGIISNGSSITPLNGYPLYAIAAYKWGGLDSKGNPQGFLNGELSNNYAAMAAEASSSGNNVEYMGPASPTYFGSVINTFRLANFSISINLNYKLGYKVRKPTFTSNQLVNSGTGHADYVRRWQNPGDEANTNIPAFLYPVNLSRDAFFLASATNVISGDHIRLDYVRLGYTIQTKEWKFPFRNLELYGGAQNVGIIWRANQYKLDPDFVNFIPATTQFTFGLRASF